MLPVCWGDLSDCRVSGIQGVTKDFVAGIHRNRAIARKRTRTTELRYAVRDADVGEKAVAPGGFGRGDLAVVVDDHAPLPPVVVNDVDAAAVVALFEWPDAHLFVESGYGDCLGNHLDRGRTGYKMKRAVSRRCLAIQLFEVIPWLQYVTEGSRRDNARIHDGSVIASREYTDDLEELAAFIQNLHEDHGEETAEAAYVTHVPEPNNQMLF